MRAERDGDGAACIQGEHNAGYGMQVQIEDGLFFNVVAPVAARLRLLLLSRTPSSCSSDSRSEKCAAGLRRQRGIRPPSPT